SIIADAHFGVGASRWSQRSFLLLLGLGGSQRLPDMRLAPDRLQRPKARLVHGPRNQRFALTRQLAHEPAQRFRLLWVLSGPIHPILRTGRPTRAGRTPMHSASGAKAMWGGVWLSSVRSARGGPHVDPAIESYY